MIFPGLKEIILHLAVSKVIVASRCLDALFIAFYRFLSPMQQLQQLPLMSPVAGSLIRLQGMIYLLKGKLILSDMEMQIRKLPVIRSIRFTPFQLQLHIFQGLLIIYSLTCSVEFLAIQPGGTPGKIPFLRSLLNCPLIVCYGVIPFLQHLTASCHIIVHPAKGQTHFFTYLQIIQCALCVLFEQKQSSSQRIPGIHGILIFDGFPGVLCDFLLVSEVLCTLFPLNICQFQISLCQQLIRGLLLNQFSNGFLCIFICFKGSLPVTHLPSQEL